MSQMFMLPSLELLLIAGRAVALVLGLLIFAWAFRHWRRAAMRDTQRVFEQLDLVRSELLIMKEVMHHSAHRDSGRDSSRDPGRDLGQSNRGDLAARPATHSRPPVAPTGTARGYEMAARMARNGANKDELMHSCGITGHEAELLVKLHGHKAPEQRSATAAELVGRQPRTTEAAESTTSAGAGLARQQTSAQVLQNQTRQTASTPRQNNAAAATQRTPVAASKQALPPRSRLVAVG